jgi:hypothetical protein
MAAFGGLLVRFATNSPAIFIKSLLLSGAHWRFYALLEGDRHGHS